MIEEILHTKETGYYDVVVCGGGIAGISAAVAAARHGAKVLLLEREYALGGLATLGLVTIYLPLCDGTGRQVCFGLAEELLRLSISNGIEDLYCPEWLESGSEEERKKTRFQVRYNPYVFAIEAEKLLRKEGVNLLYGSFVVSVLKKENRITHVIIENKSGRSAVAVGNVIDATGDADICVFAGEDTELFGQGNIPASWYYYTQDSSFNLNMLGFCDIPDSQKTEEQLQNDKLSLRFSGVGAEDLTAFTIFSHGELLADFLKDGKDSPEHALSSIAMIPQVRMTRRLNGKYVQDEDEMHKEFSDSVGLFPDWRKRGPVYELPFGTLYGKTENLIVAGRHISVTDSMWDITRVIPVCAVSGQAAGTAAAICSNFSKIDISRLQKLLSKDGVVLHERQL